MFSRSGLVIQSMPVLLQQTQLHNGVCEVFYCIKTQKGFALSSPNFGDLVTSILVTNTNRMGK